MTDEQLPPASPIRDPRLDRYARFDEHSRRFPITAVVPDTRPLRSYTWTCDTWLDQGQEGACTGFSRAHVTAARPAPKPMTNEDAKRCYYRARQLDEWAGEDYDGSSVLGAVKAAKEFGWVKTYRWAFSVDDLARGIGYVGPAAIGIDWMGGMSQTDRRGFIHATGGVQGGHAIMVNGVDVKNRTFRLFNSWGPDWGISGQALLSWSDMDLLLNRRGEACFSTKA